MTTTIFGTHQRRQPPQTKPTNLEKGGTKERERERERENWVKVEKREKKKGRKQYFNEKKRCSWNKEYYFL